MITRLLCLLLLLAAPAWPAAQDDDDVLIRRGIALFVQGDFSGALGHLKLVQAAPAVAPLRHYVAGRIYRDKEHFDLGSQFAGSPQLKRVCGMNAVYALLQQESALQEAADFPKRDLVLAEALQRAEALAHDFPPDGDLDDLLAMVRVRRGYRRLWGKDDRPGREAELRGAAEDFKAAIALKPKRIGYGVDFARVQVELAKIAKDRDPSKACDEVKAGYEAIQDGWDQHPGWRKGALADVRKMLLAQCKDFAPVAVSPTAGR